VALYVDTNVSERHTASTFRDQYRQYFISLWRNSTNYKRFKQSTEKIGSGKDDTKENHRSVTISYCYEHKRLEWVLLRTAQRSNTKISSGELDEAFICTEKTPRTCVIVQNALPRNNILYLPIYRFHSLILEKKKPSSVRLFCVAILKSENSICAEFRGHKANNVF
jgi:hypothetical protein